MKTKTYQASVSNLNGVQMEVEARGHKIVIDQPAKAGGMDKGMTPVEMMLGSLGACEAMVITILAKMHGIEIEELRVEVEGEKDVTSFIRDNPGKRNGFKNIHSHYYIKSNAPKEKILELVNISERKCPVGDSINHGVSFGKPKLTMLD